jgi:preprotein translocase subunit SecE
MKMKNPVTAITTLYKETMSEMRKCTWPTRNELYESTILVISFLIILSVVVTIADKVLLLLVRLITGV